MTVLDRRIAEAQFLLWKVDALRQLGASRKARETLLEMARLHEEIAFERLGRVDPGGWIDLYAALSAFGEAGERVQARQCLVRARDFAFRLSDEDARESVNHELDHHERWLDELMVLPSLAEMAPPIPRLPSLAAA